jgi:hypothetical protein
VKVSMMICIKKDNVNKLKISQVNLYKATKENGKWTAITPLSLTVSKSYSTNNPSIAKDGKTLYFSSNMPGSIGTDIWKVEVNSDGSFGTPENLGNKINTGDESSFISDDNLLYFSSKGLTGFEGMISFGGFEKC